MLGGILMGRNSLFHQVIHNLNGKMALGESRHEAKAALKEKLGKEYKFGATDYKIHGLDTRDNYQRIDNRFVRWCMEHRGVKKYASLEKCAPLVKEYLQYRKDSGMSVPTLKTERSALGNLYEISVDFPLPKRTPDNITRSRGPKEMDKHYSPEKNQKLESMGNSTGGRREDLEKTVVSHYRNINGHLFVDFLQSKGGRDRVTPVLPGHEDEVLKVLEETKAAGETKIFDHIHTKCDVHALRRKYAQNLYEIISKDHELRDELLKAYPPRYEPHIKGDTYTTRRKGMKNKTFLRDDIYLCSQALGHNRLDVTVTHYLL